MCGVDQAQYPGPGANQLMAAISTSATIAMTLAAVPTNLRRRGLSAVNGAYQFTSARTAMNSPTR